VGIFSLYRETVSDHKYLCGDVDGGSLESLFEDGDDKSTIIGGRFTEADCTHADAITPLQNPGMLHALSRTFIDRIHSLY
jgi:hypothetical protein